MPRKKKKIRVATLDAETNPFEYGAVIEPFAWGLAYDTGEYYYFWGSNCTEQLMEHLQDEENLRIYAHNGGKFDVHFFLEYLTEIKIINGRIAKAKLLKDSIEVRDSYLLLPQSLSEHDKDTIDYEWFRPEHREKHKDAILKYLRTDCESLLRWVLRFIEEFGDNLTLAGTAFKELKKTSYDVCNTFDEYDSKFRPFYYGGRVQCFETGAIIAEDKPYKYVDINSAYPWIMTKKHWYGSQFIEHLKMPDKGQSWFAEVTAVSHGALPFRGAEGKLYFPCDDTKRTYYATGWEIVAGIETNTLFIDKVKRVYKPLFTRSFDEYVEKFFALKKTAEENGDMVLRGFAKLLLNSCYGKFGQNGRDFKEHTITEVGVKPEGEGWNLHAIHPDFWIYERPAPTDRFYNTPTAASVTGGVRAYMWQSLNAADRPLYCDTDSIICRDFHGDIGKGLGQWDIEGEPEEIYIAQRKMYAMKLANGERKVASKGVNLNFDQIKRGVTTGQSIVVERDQPSFSLKYGTRYIKRTVDFENISRHTNTVPSAN